MAGLPQGVGVPRGPRARHEVDAGGPETGRLRGRGDGVYVDGAGEPLAGAERVSVVFLVICMSFSLSVGTAGGRCGLFG